MGMDALTMCMVEQWHPPSAQNDARASSLDEQYAQAAERIMYAMAGIEDVLVETSLRNDILCRLANDTLVALRPVED